MCKLETECDIINKKIEVIDDTLDKIDRQIDAHENDAEEELERKQCRFDDVGSLELHLSRHGHEG